MDFLPAPGTLKAVSKALAALDLIMEPDGASRCYSYNRAWAPGVAVASMRNGSGEEYDIAFLPGGAAYVRGFDHESPMSPARNDEQLWPGLTDGIPERFLQLVHEPAFGFDGAPEMTVCLWTPHGAAGSWAHGTVPPPGSPGDESGAARLFSLVSSPDPGQYAEFAADYYETEVDPAAIAEVYALRPLDQALVSRINPGRLLPEILQELREIGYPAGYPAG